MSDSGSETQDPDELAANMHAISQRNLQNGSFHDTECNVEVVRVQRPPLRREDGIDCMKWLLDNPVTATRDIVFLKKELQYYRDIAAQAFTVEQVRTAKGKRWVHQLKPALPFLRLMHCITDNDEIKKAYAKRAAPKTRQQMEMMRSQERDKSWGELLSEKWADPTFNPKTQIRPIHNEFLEEIDIGWEACKFYEAPDPEGAESRIQDMKAMVSRLILRWEQSGAGECGLAAAVPYQFKENADNVDNEDEQEDAQEEDEEPIREAQTSETEENNGGSSQLQIRHIGHYRGFAGVACADNRWYFCNRRDSPTYLLYLWDLFDEHDLLKTTCNILAFGIGVTDGGVDDASLDNTLEGSLKSSGGKSLDTQSQAIISSLFGEFRNQTAQSERENAKRREEEQVAKERLMEKELVLQRANDEHMAMVNYSRQRQLQIQTLLDNLRVKKNHLTAKLKSRDSAQVEAAQVELTGLEELIGEYKEEMAGIEQRTNTSANATIAAVATYDTPVASNNTRRRRAMTTRPDDNPLPPTRRRLDLEMNDDTSVYSDDEFNDKLETCQF